MRFGTAVLPIRDHLTRSTDDGQELLGDIEACSFCAMTLMYQEMEIFYLTWISYQPTMVLDRASLNFWVVDFA